MRHLFVVQNQKFSHVTLLHHHHQLLPVNYRADLEILLLVHDAFNGLAPDYISDMLPIYQPNRFLRSLDRCLLQIPRAHSKSGDRGISVYAPKAQNSLSARLRFSQTLFSST